MKFSILNAISLSLSQSHYLGEDGAFFYLLICFIRETDASFLLTSVLWILNMEILVVTISLCNLKVFDL